MASTTNLSSSFVNRNGIFHGLHYNRSEQVLPTSSDARFTSVNGLQWKVRALTTTKLSSSKFVLNRYGILHGLLSSNRSDLFLPRSRFTSTSSIKCHIRKEGPLEGDVCHRLEAVYKSRKKMEWVERRKKLEWLERQQLLHSARSTSIPGPEPALRDLALPSMRESLYWFAVIFGLTALLYVMANVAKEAIIETGELFRAISRLPPRGSFIQDNAAKVTLETMCARFKAAFSKYIFRYKFIVKAMETAFLVLLLTKDLIPVVQKVADVAFVLIVFCDLWRCWISWVRVTVDSPGKSDTEAKIQSLRFLFMVVKRLFTCKFTPMDSPWSKKIKKECDACVNLVGGFQD